MATVLPLTESRLIGLTDRDVLKLALSSAGANGLPTGDLYRLFGHNIKRTALHALLSEVGAIVTVERHTGGRPLMRWRLP